MRKHDWPMLLNAQARSGQTIAAFCAVRGLTRSKFYAERAKQSTPQSVVPIVVEASELRITLQLRTPIVIAGSASDLAQILRSL
jgi:hypothetical protein